MTDTRSDVWPAVLVERLSLCADLASAGEREWATPSTCAGWSVHDVLAHLVSTATMTPPLFLARFVAAGFDVGRLAEREIRRHARPEAAATLAAFRAAATRRSSPPGPQVTWLGETIVHAEDIRRPLGIVHTYPSDALALLLRFYARSNAIIGGRDRIAGLTLTADDAAVTVGAGPVVEGPLLDLVLATTGRRDAFDHLRGPGLETLRQRP